MTEHKKKGNSDERQLTVLSKRLDVLTWIARLMVIIVFILNVQCALQFIFLPYNFMGAYELTGVSGRVALQGIGVAFLMWNATYPIVIFSPAKYMVVYSIILVQQFIGFVGESYLLFMIPLEHTMLRGSIIRFIVFDGAGLVIMGIPFIFLLVYKRKIAKLLIHST
jgi:hypothetical protein